ncbi:hypothetical protein AYI69_g3978 [Smittium culicis]|uniref:Uncharacterized protein n=1 Tax=Smittium culicis TaxID=133412 RepID=A0A1R1YI23_9FUNG|nr:hypothetical protein AYI69_g3978 [Smittium culicis]
MSNEFPTKNAENTTLAWVHELYTRVNQASELAHILISKENPVQPDGEKRTVQPVNDEYIVIRAPQSDFKLHPKNIEVIPSIISDLFRSPIKDS